MSASQASALSAIAFQLAATLEAYEEDVAALVRFPLASDIYLRVSRHVDAMRMYSAALPSLSGAWVEVLIRHFELTHALLRAQKQGHPAVVAEQFHQQLREAVGRLRQLCVRAIAAA